MMIYGTKKKRFEATGKISLKRIDPENQSLLQLALTPSRTTVLAY
jgi:hypothetical protein